MQHIPKNFRIVFFSIAAVVGVAAFLPQEALAQWTNVGQVNGVQVWRDERTSLEWTVTIGQVQSSGWGEPARTMVERYGFRLPSFRELQVMEANGGFGRLNVRRTLGQYYETSDSNILGAAWGNGFRTPQQRQGRGMNWVIGVRQKSGGGNDITPHVEPPVASQPQVHLIAIADVHSNLSAGSKKSVEEFSFMMWYGLGKNSLIVHHVEDGDLYPRRILERIGNLKIGKNDTVIFLYAGHGAFDRNRGLFYTITDPSIPFRSKDNPGTSNFLLKDDVLKTIQKHSPRLTVIISDCCSTHLRYHEQEELVRAANMESTRPLFQRLFFETSGVVDFTAAQEGKFGFICSRDGHYMIHNLCKQMDINMDRRLNWGQFFPIVQQETAEYSRIRYSQNPNAMDSTFGTSLWTLNGVSQIPQVPRAFSLGN